MKLKAWVLALSIAAAPVAGQAMDLYAMDVPFEVFHVAKRYDPATHMLHVGDQRYPVSQEVHEALTGDGVILSGKTIGFELDQAGVVSVLRILPKMR